MKNFRSTLRFSGQRWIGVSLPYDRALGEEFKTLVAIRAWDAATKTWWFPESYEPLVRQMLRQHDLCDEDYLVKFAVALEGERQAQRRAEAPREMPNGTDLPPHMVAEVRHFDGSSGQMLNKRGELSPMPAGGGEIKYGKVPRGAPAAVAGDDADPYQVLCITQAAPTRLVELAYKFWKREFDSGAPDTPLFRVEQAYERIITKPEWGY